jgi:hypothetical protein
MYIKGFGRREVFGLSIRGFEFGWCGMICVEVDGRIWAQHAGVAGNGRLRGSDRQFRSFYALLNPPLVGRVLSS